MFALYSVFSQFINCSLYDMDCLRSKSITEIISAQVQSEKIPTSSNFLQLVEPWVPYNDGIIIKGEIIEIDKWIDNKFEFKAIIIGTTTEESIAAVFSLVKNPMNTNDLYGYLIFIFKQNFSKFLAAFELDSDSDKRNMLSKVVTHFVYTCSSRSFLDKYLKLSSYSAYLYVFDFSLDYDGWNSLPFCDLHKCHSCDLPYTFNVPKDEFTSDGVLIASQKMKYWSNFAKYSTPNSDETLKWPKYDSNNRLNIRFQSGSNIIEGNYSKLNCDFFDSIGYFF
jgi:carboxylesterase type B